MAQTAVPQIAGAHTVTSALTLPEFVPGKLVIKVVYPVYTFPQSAIVGVSDPVRAPSNVQIALQIPAQGTLLDPGGTVTAILFGTAF